MPSVQLRRVNRDPPLVELVPIRGGRLTWDVLKHQNAALAVHAGAPILPWTTADCSPPLLLTETDGLHLDLVVVVQARHLYGRSRRRGALVDVLPVEAIHRFPILHIGEIDVDLHRPPNAAPTCSPYRLEVVEDQLALVFERSGDDQRLRIARDASACEQQVSDPDPLSHPGDVPGCVIRANLRSIHLVPSSLMAPHRTIHTSPRSCHVLTTTFLSV